MSTKISFGLSVSELREAARLIRQYNDNLQQKCEELCRRLCDEGIQIAQSNIRVNGLGKYIHLASEVTAESIGCKAVIYMEDSQKLHSYWQNLDGEQEADISPSLMIEFGSGLKAENPAGIPGVGTGTFGVGHGSDPSGWWHMDLDGNWHHSGGYAAEMPMYKAGQDLRFRIFAIAKEVFG